MSRILCPGCGERGKTRILDSRQTDRDGRDIRWRRRACSVCEHRWSTVEMSADEYERWAAVARAASALAAALA